jgi:hypothetical protein
MLAPLLVVAAATCTQATTSTLPHHDYLVVAVNPRPVDDGYHTVPVSVKSFHNGWVEGWDGRDESGLREIMHRQTPVDVLFIVRPEDLDINLHRRILSVCTRMDDDPFCDFSFGYLTARTPEALMALWNRTVELHSHGLANHTWVQSSITSGQKSMRYEDGNSGLRKDAGFSGPSLYFAEVASDPDVGKRIDEWLPQLEPASVIELTGNADPQGIWVFSGERNRDRSKHWSYDPAKIGQDPEHCMPRITADRFRALHLSSPIVWSGACHTGATHKVFVEGDIVSTFGRTERTTLFEMPTDQSIALALIDAGAVAFLGPIGPNHGFSTLNEQEFALENGASLGEALKATYDDALLACGGNPVLPRYVPGAPQPEEPNIMAAGGLNRILIGDPSLAPFKATARKGEATTIGNVRVGEPGKPAGFDVVVKWDAGFHARAWDMYGGNRQRDGRITARISLDDPALSGNGKGISFGAAVEAADDKGSPLDYRLTRLAIEEDRGRRFLHLQANTIRKDVQGKAVIVRFHVYPAP